MFIPQTIKDVLYQSNESQTSLIMIAPVDIINTTSSIFAIQSSHCDGVLVKITLCQKVELVWVFFLRYLNRQL